MSCLLYNIAIKLLAETIRKLALEAFKIQGLEKRILVLLFMDDILVYMNENDNKKTLEQTIKTSMRPPWPSLMMKSQKSY